VGLFGSLLGQGPLLAGTLRFPGEFLELPNKLGELKPGIYCVSATYLQGMHKPPPFRGQWSEETERLYQEGMVFRWQYDHRFDDDERTLLTRYQKDGRAAKLVSAYYELRLARLINYLRERCRPFDNVNDSILIFQVTEEQLEEALQPLVLPE
jgi:hypothetical protein